MKLIIEAGASKSDWLVFDEVILNRQSTLGINPSSNPGSEAVILSKDLVFPPEIEQVFYYGAGTREPMARQMIVNQLTKRFGNLDRLEVNTDLTAAARACYQDETCIINILGTGSNTALYDGRRFIQSLPSPGFLLEDYGSGFAIGRAILLSYLYKEMNKNDLSLFERNYPEIMHSFIPYLYKQAKPNYIIGQYAEFLNHSSEDLKDLILHQVFEDFLKNRISKIENSLNYSLNFVGSISYHFKPHLKLCCESNGYKLGKILKSPLEALFEYHLNAK